MFSFVNGDKGYVVLDIELDDAPGGIYFEEIELVTPFQKKIKPFGIVEFMEKTLGD